MNPQDTQQASALDALKGGGSLFPETTFSGGSSFPTGQAAQNQMPPNFNSLPPQGQQFLRALDYSRQNPNSDFANAFAAKIRDGEMAPYAKMAGIDISPYIQKTTQNQNSTNSQPNEGGVLSTAGKIAENVLGGVPALENAIPGMKDFGTGFAKSIVNDFGNRANTIIKGANDMADSVNQGDILRGTLKGGELLGTAAGEVAGGVGDIIAEVAKSLLPQGIKDNIKSQLQKFPDSPIGKVIMPLVNSYNSFAQSNPEVAQQIGNVINTVSLLGGKEIEQPAKEAVGAGTESIEKGLGNTLKVATDKAAESAANTERENVLKVIMPEDRQAAKEVEGGMRTSNKTGLLGRVNANPTKQEEDAVDILRGVVSPKMTFTENKEAIQQAISKEANSLKNSLSEAPNRFIAPKKELLSKLDGAAQTLSESPTLVGDAEKTAQKIINGAKKFINQSDGTGSGYLEARKKFDIWVKNQAPKAFDPNYENAQSIALRTIRQTWNSFLEEKAPNAGVLQSLKNQSLLYNALDNVAPKAAKEIGTNGFQRMISGAKSLVMRHPWLSTEAALGVGAGGMMVGHVLDNPIILSSLIAGGVYKFGKTIITSEGFKNTLSDILKTASDALSTEDKNTIRDIISKIGGSAIAGTPEAVSSQTIGK